jgi:hypothetical protein
LREPLDKETSERIRKRIEESKREYSPQEQKAELLKRNKQFLLELQQASQEKQIQDLSYSSRHKVRLATYPEKIKASYIYMDRAFRFRDFCDEWQISCKWDGDVATLGQFIRVMPQIIYDNVKAGEKDYHLWYPREKWETFEDYKENICQDDPKLPISIDFENNIYIKIDAFTHFDDIEKIRPRIIELQNKICGFTDREKRDFGRNLCWYDLNKDKEFGKCSAEWIARHWKGHVSRNTVKASIQRIQLYIDRLNPK